jgi:protoporphyrinogen oxidase
MARREQIIVLGAGLAGLAAAYRLKRGYRLLEKKDHVGGLCETLEEGGYRFDRTGHLLHLNHPRIRRMVNSLLDEPPLELARESRIFSQGVYTQYPFQANTYGLPPETVAECLTGFIAAVQRKGASKPAAETFEEFILAHFGEGIARHFMIPYNHKLWGVHPREITSAWCQRFVPVPSAEEVVAGAVGLAQDRMGYNASFLYPRTGIAELPEALARKVGGAELGSAPRAIDHRRRRIRLGGEWLPYRALISTIPLKNLVGLLVEPPQRIARAAELLRCTGLRYLDVALDRECGTPYHWSYVPERKYPFYRVGCYSNFSSRMAPRGKANLYVELAARGPVKLDRTLPRVAAGLAEMGIIERPADIAFARPRFLAHAYVVYDKHYQRNVPRLLAWLEERGILCAGRYARWEYAAMEDALVQGLDAADRAKEY